MITNIFISALGQAIFESCGQALLIYVVLQLGMQLFPGITSKYKYDVYYLGLTIITCWFLANLVNIYMHDVTLAKYAILLSGNTATYGIRYVPTLLQQAEAFIAKYATYITGLYMIGLILHAFKLLGGFIHIYHIRKQRNLTTDSFWTAKANQLSEKLKVIKKVSLYFSAQVQIPLTIGYIKPIIIFPIALINNLDTDQVESILLHEMAHIKRHDYLLNILQYIMETILCFNPFVWLISKTIRQEREHCCDDMVMDADYNSFTYSKALFIIAQQKHQNYSLAMASANTNKYPLLNRIKRLNTMKNTETLPKFHLLVIIAVAAIGTLLAWGVPQYSAAKTTSPKMNKTKSYHFNKFSPASPLRLTFTPAENAKAKNETIASSMNSKASITISRDTALNNNFNGTSKTHTTKFKIVIEDDKGNKKEYNSLNDLPQADKDEFLKENPNFGGLTYKVADSMQFASIEKFKMSPEWKKTELDMKLQAEKLSQQFNSPEWKKQVAEMKANGEKTRAYFNSPEWKKQVADMKADGEKTRAYFNSPEWKKQVEDMKADGEKTGAYFNSPEWKKQVEDMKANGEKTRAYFNSPEWKKQQQDIKQQSEAIRKQFNSPEWKKQMEDIKIQAEKMNAKFNSPEWKKQMEDMQDKIKKETDEQIKAAEADSTKAAQDKSPQ